MDESKDGKNNEIDYEINKIKQDKKEEKEDKIENEKKSASDNQSLNNQENNKENSLSKSFESEKNEKKFINKENIVKFEEIKNNINENNIIKNNLNIEKENISEDNNIKKIEETNNDIKENEINKNHKEDENKKENEKNKEDKIQVKIKNNEQKNKKIQKYKIEDIIKEVNKEPDLGFVNRSKIKTVINKIKNKSFEKTLKAILASESRLNEGDDGKNFRDKLRNLKSELSKREEINEYKKRNINIDLILKTYKGHNRRYNNDIIKNEDLNDFNLNIKEPISLNENKFKELKEKYYVFNRILFSSVIDDKYNKYNLSLHKEKPKQSNSQEIKKIFDNKFNKQIIYRKNPPKIPDNKNNEEIFRLINSNDNFDSIIKKFKKQINFNCEEKKYEIKSINKNDTKLNKLNSYNYKNSNKLKNLINNIFNEIKDNNIKNYNFKNRLINIKSKITYSHSLNKYFNSDKKIKTSRYNYPRKKTNNKNFNELLNLCSQENFKKYRKSKNNLIL